MTTASDIIVRLGRKLRSLALLTAALELALGPARPAWAQRRREEPQANPQFQQQLDNSPADASGAPVAASDLSGGGAAAQNPNAADVQIGTAPAPKPRPRESTNPLDARVTVRVKGAPLATFLDTISAQAHVNFIITEGLESKRVTAFLQNVSVREALQVLLEIKGLTYEEVGHSNTYLVTPRSKDVENLVTRIYTLSYIPLIPLDTGSPGGQQQQQNGQGSAPGMTGGNTGQAGAPTTGSQPGTTADAISILNVLRSVLTEKGKVAIEPRTNSLIVTDVPEVFPQVEQILSELDKKAPQVMIELQIVEIDSTKTKDLGLEWGASDGELAAFNGGQRDTTFPMQLPNNLSRTRFLDPVGAGNIISTIGSAGAASATGFTTGSFIKTSVLDLTSLQVILRALIETDEARFLGKPKILTLNNKKATIQISREQADYVIQTITSGLGGISQAGAQIHTDETGLILNVTPQVNKDGYITMLVNPSFTDIQQSVISSAAQPVFDPITRSASTLVRVKNGQTLVLGGLLESKDDKVTRKVPLLGYIPLIGWLFTSVTNTRTNTDLVIFLTPTIVND